MSSRRSARRCGVVFRSDTAESTNLARRATGRRWARSMMVRVGVVAGTDRNTPARRSSRGTGCVPQSGSGTVQRSTSSRRRAECTVTRPPIPRLSMTRANSTVSSRSNPGNSCRRAADAWHTIARPSRKSADAASRSSHVAGTPAPRNTPGAIDTSAPEFRRCRTWESLIPSRSSCERVARPTWASRRRRRSSCSALMTRTECTAVT